MTYTQQGISVTFTKDRLHPSFYVEIKIPSTVVKSPRTIVVKTKHFSLTVVCNHSCFHDSVIRFYQDYNTCAKGDYLSDKPLSFSYEDEFYQYEITLQPSLYQLPTCQNSKRLKDSRPTYGTHSRFSSPRTIPYTYTNIRRPYFGGKVT